MVANLGSLCVERTGVSTWARSLPNEFAVCWLTILTDGPAARQTGGQARSLHQGDLGVRTWHHHMRFCSWAPNMYAGAVSHMVFRVTLEMPRRQKYSDASIWVTRQKVVCYGARLV